MKKLILLLSDIHGNYPALQAVEQRLDVASYDIIVNCGDSLVYAPFPNETLEWLVQNQVISILGNTDKKVIKLLQGKSFKKPGKEQKRIMYQSTAEALTLSNRSYLLSLPKSTSVKLSADGNKGKRAKNKKSNQSRPECLDIFHGSPAHHHEFLFDSTPDSRFHELTELTRCQIVVTGHSHTPYHKLLSQVHFINPGSVGRMFDGDPRASCASLTISSAGVSVQHHRIRYKIDDVVEQLKICNLPELYSRMFESGKKLN